MLNLLSVDIIEITIAAAPAKQNFRCGFVKQGLNISVSFWMVVTYCKKHIREEYPLVLLIDTEKKSEISLECHGTLLSD